MSDTVVSRDRIHVLPRGRSLGSSEYGMRDGNPVMYFHGIPGSRLDDRFVAGAAAQANMRMVAADRLGFCH